MVQVLTLHCIPPPHMQDLSRHVVQVLTLHCIPNFMRPWEVGHDVESSSSAFVVDRARRWVVHGRGGRGEAGHDVESSSSAFVVDRARR